jgi:hypothetical protein
MTGAPGDPGGRGARMIEGRRADSARRRQRVVKAINDAVGAGEEVSVSAIARKAGIDRSFFYRPQHGDLLAQVHVTAAAPPAALGSAPAVSVASLKADLANSQDRCTRLTARVRMLEKRLSEALGESAWRESGLGAPDDIGDVKQRVITLEQEIAGLRLALEERDCDLDAARAANRELIAQLNSRAEARP